MLQLSIHYELVIRARLQAKYDADLKTYGWSATSMEVKYFEQKCRIGLLDCALILFKKNLVMEALKCLTLAVYPTYLPDKMLEDIKAIHPNLNQLREQYNAGSEITSSILCSCICLHQVLLDIYLI